MQKTKNILFVCYGGGHVNMIIPVYELIKNDPRFNITILALTAAQPKLSKLGIPHITFRNLLTEGDANALEIGRKLLPSLEQSGLVAEKESIA